MVSLCTSNVSSFGSKGSKFQIPLALFTMLWCDSCTCIAWIIFYSESIHFSISYMVHFQNSAFVFYLLCCFIPSLIVVCFGMKNASLTMCVVNRFPIERRWTADHLLITQQLFTYFSLIVIVIVIVIVAYRYIYSNNNCIYAGMYVCISAIVKHSRAKH